MFSNIDWKRVYKDAKAAGWLGQAVSILLVICAGDWILERLTNDDPGGQLIGPLVMIGLFGTAWSFGAINGMFVGTCVSVWRQQREQSQI
jgi:hypothetical protein